MRNYGEELAYWYLRLNGFFPLVDFVLHRGALLEHPSDCDLLAIRPPYVVEETGGQAMDWDQRLAGLFHGDCTVGILCEVKTGDYQTGELFQQTHVRYAVERLGLVTDPSRTVAELANRATVEPAEHIRITKLLIAQDQVENAKFLSVTLAQVREFIRTRMAAYDPIKYGDRHFFPSPLLQYIIDEVHHA